MKKGVIFGLLMALLALFAGCEKAREHKRRYGDPNGSTQEQITYHQNEIRKYQIASDNEREKSIKSLQSRHMSEVRRCNNKQDKYQKKIAIHEKEIQTLREDSAR